MATAIITGASSGIGRGVAKLFASAGYKLVLCGRNEQELKATIRLCSSPKTENDHIATFVGDIAARDACQRIVDEAIRNFKRIDVLVNNAGMLLPGSPPDGLKIEDLNTMLKVNLLSAVDLSLRCLRHLMATKGCIVNVSSICGIKALPDWTFYSVTKAAMDMFTKMMALEMAPHGVRVNSVNPGIIPTQVHSRRPEVSKEAIDEYYKACVKTIPMRTVGTVENIAEMVLFLSSDKASYITGQTHVVDGGAAIYAPFIRRNLKIRMNALLFSGKQLWKQSYQGRAESDLSNFLRNDENTFIKHQRQSIEEYPLKH